MNDETSIKIPKQTKGGAVAHSLPQGGLVSSPFPPVFKGVTITKEGYFYVHHKFAETSFYRNSHAVHLALHCIHRANFYPTKQLQKGKEIIISRGSFVTGRLQLAFETGMSPSTTRNTLKLLKNVGFLDIKTSNKFSIITIIKYEEYQREKIKNSRKRTAEGHQMDTPEDTPEDTPYISILTKGTKGTNKEDTLSFWNYFLLKTEKRFTLTKDRRALIEKRLGEYSLDDLKRAVDNFVSDDWKGRQSNLDLIYCIGKQKGKRDNLEYWFDYSKKTGGAKKWLREHSSEKD